MAIASMVCGIVGLSTLLFCGVNILVLLHRLNQIQDNILFFILQAQIEDRLSVLYLFVFVSFVLVLLALIFGNIERKKGKITKYYNMAKAGFIMGIIGIILTILPIVFVTGSTITFNIMNRGGRAQTHIADPISPYIGVRPQFAFFNQIGTITTRTRDFPANIMVTVEMILGYDINDAAATVELISRRYELRDFTRRFFEDKTAAELAPEKEDELRREIREQLNTCILDTARIRIVLFNRLDVMETF